MEGPPAGACVRGSDVRAGGSASVGARRGRRRGPGAADRGRGHARPFGTSGDGTCRCCGPPATLCRSGDRAGRAAGRGRRCLDAPLGADPGPRRAGGIGPLLRLGWHRGVPGRSRARVGRSATAGPRAPRAAPHQRTGPRPALRAPSPPGVARAMRRGSAASSRPCAGAQTCSTIPASWTMRLRWRVRRRRRSPPPRAFRTSCRALRASRSGWGFFTKAPGAPWT